MGLKSGAGDNIYEDTADEPGEHEEPNEEPEREADTVEVDDEPSEPTHHNQPIDADQSSDGRGDSSDDDLPYIVRRSIRDKGIQYERDERLTFFVHDDVSRTESEVVSRLEAELGRDLPVMDVREAAYRFALTREDEILQELIEMGYRRE